MRAFFVSDPGLHRGYVLDKSSAVTISHFPPFEVAQAEPCGAHKTSRRDSSPLESSTLCFVVARERWYRDCPDARIASAISPTRVLIKKLRVPGFPYDWHSCSICRKRMAQLVIVPTIVAHHSYRFRYREIVKRKVGSDTKMSRGESQKARSFAGLRGNGQLITKKLAIDEGLIGAMLYFSG